MADVRSSNHKSTAICPYLHQLQVDWLSMDTSGFYCHGAHGETKMLDGTDRTVVCTFPDFTACAEYRLARQEERASAPARRG